jgi:restriction system-associated AAA family ATPase
MRLLRFKINMPNGFRSLQPGFEIHFLKNDDYSLAKDFNPNILAGRNGSGKSNILEALASIFYHLDCMYSDYLPDGFLLSEENQSGFDNTYSIVDAFELEYFIPIPIILMDKSIKDIPQIPINQTKAHISIKKEIGQPPVFNWLNRDDYSLIKGPLGKKEIQYLLPKYIIGYSSGENELLSLPFFKTRFLHFDEYADKLAYEEPFGYPPKSEGRLVYLDSQFSQAILLSNLLMQDSSVLEPFKEEIEIEGLDEFRLIICLDKYIDLHYDILRDKNLTEEQIKSERLHQIQLTYNLRDSIEILKKCATCFTTHQVENDNKEDIREYLFLDYKVTPATINAFRFHFAEDPLQLFQLFQILLELNAYVVSLEDKKRVYQSKNIFINQDIYPNPLENDRIIRFKNLGIKKEGIRKSLFTKELSDGEHQFLHSLGVCLLFKNKNCLFLLDEPESHFNPDWKAKFITGLRSCFSIDEHRSMREMIITTHSPYLISDSESKYVHVFNKDETTKKVSCDNPQFQTLGASINKITIEVFKTPLTIGQYAYTFLADINKRYENKEDSVTLVNELENVIGDSVEKTLLIHKILK